jgi:60 kDa SS-A/Ro ribonucleoprotein
MLERFLILGTEGGSYYANEKKLTVQNATNIVDLISRKGKYVVDTIVSISDEGRAPSNDPALFALALCASAGFEHPTKQDIETRQYALSMLPKVARIGTHLFHFAQYVSNLRGFGKTLRKALSNWYINRPNGSLANQVLKYQARDGWSHRDILRLSHPKVLDDKEKMNILAWVAQNPKRPFELSEEGPLGMIWAYEQILKTKSETEIVKLIKKYNLPMEAIPSEKQSPSVFETYYPTAGMTWLLRNLGNLSKHGILTPNSNAMKIIRDRITSQKELTDGRIHPIAVLKALKTYSSGRGFRGSGSWTTVQPIVDALDDAFYLSFKTIEPDTLGYLKIAFECLVSGFD